ncbi:hypothetical protein ACIA6D_23435 [Streptomyces cacaoi]
MGLFSRKPSAHVETVRQVAADLEQRERTAEATAQEARQRVQKWDRVVRNMTGRGEDNTGRDLAIRNRTRAQSDLAAAETEQLTAKHERSAFRR